MCFSLFLITSFKPFVSIWLLQTDYYSFLREITKKLCLGRLIKTLDFAEEPTQAIPSPIRILQKKKKKTKKEKTLEPVEPVEPETGLQMRTCKLGNTWHSQAAKIFTLKELPSEHLSFPFYFIFIFYRSYSSGLCHKLQAHTWMLVR